MIHSAEKNSYLAILSEMGIGGEQGEPCYKDNRGNASLLKLPYFLMVCLKKSLHIQSSSKNII